jgi:CubicO group peptidase (beta-lactamase class C family)
MTKTHFHDDYTEIEKNRAYSYQRKDSSRCNNSILSYSNSGATSLFTTINDMSKWVMNFYTHTLNDESIINQLVIPAKLNNREGPEFTHRESYRINTRLASIFTWAVADAGYRTYLSAFPDLKAWLPWYSVTWAKRILGGKAICHRGILYQGQLQNQ